MKGFTQVAKVDMKNTDYYKSGKMRENGLAGLQKGKLTCAEKTRNRIEQYNLYPNFCQECHKPLSYKQRRYICCSHACSAAKSNRYRKSNGYEISQDQRAATSMSVKKIQYEKRLKNCEIYNNDPKSCIQCSSPIPYERKHAKTCSKECLNLINKKSGQCGGLKTASGPKAKRSKNEIDFFNLCEQSFKKVTANDPLFDGWDADVLIHDYKIAILWNGDWHYREMGCYNHSLLQVQNRDNYKAELIKKHGWLVYIIKDTTDHPTKPADAMSVLNEWILTNLTNY